MTVTETSAPPPNPYASSSLDIDGVSAATIPPRRPVGTTVLAVLLVAMGVLLIARRGFSLLYAFSAADEVAVHPAYCVSIASESVMVVTAIAAAVGLLMGKKWGWWLAVVHSYWRLGGLLAFGAYTARYVRCFSTLAKPRIRTPGYVDVGSASAS